MSRYSREVRLEQPIDVVSMVMEDFVYHNRFSRTDWNGEMVFCLKDSHKKECYMKWSYVDGLFHVEAWLKGPFGGEADLGGLGASRREFREKLDGLIETLKKTAAASLTGGHIGSDPLHHDGGHGDNHAAWERDTRWQQGAPGQAMPARQTGPAPQAAPVRQGNPGNLSGTAQERRSTSAGRDPEAGKALAYAILAVFLGGWIPVLGIVFLVLAKQKEKYSSNGNVVKGLCIVAIITIVMGFLGGLFNVLLMVI